MVKDLAANAPGPWLDMEGRQMNRLGWVQRHGPAEGNGACSVAQSMVRVCLQGGPCANAVLPMDSCPALLFRLASVALSVDTGLEPDDRLVTNQPPQDVVADPGGHRRPRGEHIR